MSEYSQPDFYRFSEDSLRLVNFVASLSEINPESVADLGCGCGVIGIEYARRKNTQHLSLLEAQRDFLPHLEANLEAFMPKDISVEIKLGLFSELPWEGREFDLILCNPPFYLPGQGEVAKDPRRHRCRTFELDSWEILIGLTKRILASQGRAYFVLPKEQRLIQRVRSLGHQADLLVDENPDQNLCYLGMRLNKN